MDLSEICYNNQYAILYIKPSLKFVDLKSAENYEIDNNTIEKILKPELLKINKVSENYSKIMSFELVSNADR